MVTFGSFMPRTCEELEEAPALDRTAYRRLEHPAD